MKPVSRIATAILLVGASHSSLSAQSLEQTYAEKCSKGEGGEACEVLRKAMLEKLSSGSSPERPIAKMASEASADEEGSNVLSPWEFWSDLAGTSWRTQSGRMISYNWKHPERVLEAHVHTAGNTSINTIALNEDGSSLSLALTGGKIYQLGAVADGVSEQLLPSEGKKHIYRRKGDSILVETFALNGGQWKSTGVEVRERLAPDEVTKAVQAAQKVEQVSLSPDVAADWGILAQLAGNKYYLRGTSPNYSSFFEYTWVRPGEELKVESTFVMSQKKQPTFIYHRDPVTREIWFHNPHLGKRQVFKNEGDRQVSRVPISKDEVALSAMWLEGGNMISESYMLKHGKKVSGTGIRTVSKRVTGKSLQDVRAELQQQVNVVLAERKAAAEEKARRERVAAAERAEARRMERELEALQAESSGPRNIMEAVVSGFTQEMARQQELNRESQEVVNQIAARARAARRREEAEESRRRVAQAESAAERQRLAQAAAEARERQRAEAATRKLAAEAEARRQSQLADASVGSAQASRSASTATSPSKGGSRQEAKTSDDDARTCVSRPVVSASDTFKGQTAAVVFNGCKTAVDVRVCLLRTGGWNCGMRTRLQPQARWTHTSFETQGEVFWDARVSGSNQPLASPDAD